MGFFNLPSSKPSDALVTTGLQSAPSNQKLFLQTFQGDHLSGESFVGSSSNAQAAQPMMTRIMSEAVTSDFRHVQQDWNGNGYYAPTNKIDARALGGSPHGTHPQVDNFMRLLYLASVGGVVPRSSRGFAHRLSEN